MADTANQEATGTDSFDEVDLLVSALLDDTISDTESQQLNSLLLEDADARARYLEGIQLHVDLVNYFHPVDSSAEGTKSPVLSFLGKLDLAGTDAEGVALPPTGSAESAE